MVSCSYKIVMILDKCQRASIQNKILIGNFKTQSYVLRTAFFCSQVSKITLNALNCYMTLTNRSHVAVHLVTKRSQLMTKCGKNKKVMDRTMWP